MMNSKFRFKAVEVAGVSGVILLSTLGGCVTHVDGPRTGSVYVESPRETVIVTNDDYVYYPDYEVYYSRRHHHYIYQERGSWVSYREPRHVPVRVLVASPSVRLNLQDSPQHQHARVRQQYPKHRSSSGDGSEHRKDDRDDEKRRDGKNRG